MFFFFRITVGPFFRAPQSLAPLRRLLDTFLVSVSQLGPLEDADIAYIVSDTRSRLRIALTAASTLVTNAGSRDSDDGGGNASPGAGYVMYHETSEDESVHLPVAPAYVDDDGIAIDDSVSDGSDVDSDHKLPPSPLTVVRALRQLLCRRPRCARHWS